MKHNSLKKFYIFFLPIFIFILHIPFVFAKVIPVSKKIEPESKMEAHATKIVSAIPIKYIEPLYNKAISKTVLYDSLKLNMMGLSKEAFDCGVKGFRYLKSLGKLNNDNILSIVDFSLPSSRKRLFVIDMENVKVLFNTYVAHGRNSGKIFANKFSNKPESNKSSLGFYITKETYIGDHGISLQLEGEEKGINDNASKRAIVIHKADYVSESLIESQGYIGRSLGCPALPDKYSKPIIETIKNGSCFFMFSPNSNYLSHSKLLHSAS
jgi:hypothetical protein